MNTRRLTIAEIILWLIFQVWMLLNEHSTLERKTIQ